MSTSNSSTWSMSPLESSVFHSGRRKGGLPDLSGSWEHGFRCRTNGFSSRNVGGEFVGKISVTGLLPKLDAGATYNGWIFGGRLRFYPKNIAEKIPMGFNSKESFTKVNEDNNVADQVQVEMMQLKLVQIKKATEEGASGESQTPFREMVE
jgi:hypothetical protein